MKKLTCLLLISVTIILFLTGCKKDEEDLSLISIQTLNNTYSNNVKQIKIKIINHTGSRKKYKLGCDIEKLEGDNWVKVDIVDNKANQEEINVAVKNNTYNLEQLTLEFLETPTPGEYRIVKKIGSQEYYAEFDITE